MKAKLSHASTQFRQTISNELPAEEQFEIESLSKIERPLNIELQQSIGIINCTDMTSSCQIEYQGEKMAPFKLASGRGVEFRGQYSYQYKGASQVYIDEVNAARKGLESDISHCKKLLRELPIALDNSKKAMARLSESSDPGINEMGCMVLEQKRINTEIQQQKEKLKRLESVQAPQFDKSRFIQHTRQLSMILPFGMSRLGGKVYRIFRIENPIQEPRFIPA